MDVMAKNKKKKKEEICPIVTNGASTGWHWIQPGSKQYAKSNQNIPCWMVENLNYALIEMWNNLFFLYANFLAHVYMFIKVFYVADEFVFM